MYIHDRPFKVYACIFMYYAIYLPLLPERYLSSAELKEKLKRRLDLPDIAFFLCAGAGIIEHSNVKAIEYWAERKITPLSTLALQFRQVQHLLNIFF